MPVKILLVEDEQDLAILLTKRLLSQGYEADWVSHGSVAMQKIREYSPDLVILDLMLPGRDGLSILRDVRRESPSMRVLVLSGMQNPAYKKQVLEAGVQGYMQKPYESQIILETIRKILTEP